MPSIEGLSGTLLTHSLQVGYYRQQLAVHCAISSCWDALGKEQGFHQPPPCRAISRS